MLPEHHLSTDTKDTVKLAMGLVAAMTALLLGLLVASAKATYDSEKNSLTTQAAKLVLLDRMLAHFGTDSQPTRDLIRRTMEKVRQQIWSPVRHTEAQVSPLAVSGESIYDAIEALSPKDAAGQQLKTAALSEAVQIGEMRWLLFEQARSPLPLPLLIFVTCWLAILFGSFGLFAPANGTAIVALAISALAVSASIFLIIELNEPFAGFIKIPSDAFDQALLYLGK